MVMPVRMVEFVANCDLLVDDEKLKPVNARPALLDYVRSLVSRWDFIWAEAKGRSSSRNQDLFLGRLWNVLSPLLNAAMYGVIFGLLLNTSHGIDNFVGYLVIGIIYFNFASQGLTTAGTLIRSSKNLINSFKFPTASVVLSTGLRQSIENAEPALVAVVFAVLFQLDKGISWTVILVAPIYFLMHVFSTGVMFFVARATAFIPDLKSIIFLVHRAWFYISGVFFSISRFVKDPSLQRILEFNPAYQFLAGVRECVLAGEVPSLKYWVFIVVVSFSVFVLGLIFFWQAEDRYVRAK